MEKEEIAVEGAVTIGEVTLLPIVRTWVGVRHAGSGIVCSASKRPLAVVIVSPDGLRALNVEGEEIAIEDCLELVPALRDML